MQDDKQERSRRGCIYPKVIYPHWRELLFVTALGRVQKPLYGNIQLAYAFYVFQFG